MSCKEPHQFPHDWADHKNEPIRLCVEQVPMARSVFGFDDFAPPLSVCFLQYYFCLLLLFYELDDVDGVTMKGTFALIHVIHQTLKLMFRPCRWFSGPFAMYSLSTHFNSA